MRVSLLSSSSICFSRAGTKAYLISATRWRLPSRSAFWDSMLSLSISSFLALIWSRVCFSFCQLSLRAFKISFFSARVLSSFSILVLESFSWVRAARSISSWVIWRESSSISAGEDWSSILRTAVASSRRSTALSGRKRSVM